MSRGRIHQLSVSNGGVPKTAIEQVRITRLGLEGDSHDKPKIHGGPLRAVCLYALEEIAALAAEGHPISPGSVGENVTTEGIDWASLEPGMRLRLGADVRIEIVSFTAPCRTIAGSFSDGGFRRLDAVRNPGHARVYAEVLEEGVVRTGDAIEVLPADAGAPERAASAAEDASPPRIAYANVYVTDLARTLRFFHEDVGLAVQHEDAAFGYASLEAGPIRMGLAQIDAADEEQRKLTGRQTGIGFAVADLEAAHARLAARGVDFPMKPARQPWGGFMAMFADPDGNLFYLDELASDT